MMALSGDGQILKAYTTEVEGGTSRDSLDDVFNDIVGILPDTGKTLEEYRAERIQEKYGTVD